MLRSVLVVCGLAGCGRLGFDVLDDGHGDGGIGADGATSDLQPVWLIRAAGVWGTDPATLTRTFASSVSRDTFTFATWYLSNNEQTMLLCAPTAGQYSYWFADPNTGVPNLGHQGSAIKYEARPDYGGQPFPHLGTWVHLVVAVDLTQATQAQRVRWWIDGTEMPVTNNVATPFPQGFQLFFGDTVPHTIGRSCTGPTGYQWSGQLAETYWIWGNALDASFFVESIAPGVVRSIAYAGPITSESVYFDYQTVGQNRFAGQPSWTVTNVTSTTTNLPY